MTRGVDTSPVRGIFGSCEPGAPHGNQNASRNKTTVCDTHSCSGDGHDARGIRRRLQKRANALFNPFGNEVQRGIAVQSSPIAALQQQPLEAPLH